MDRPPQFYPKHIRRRTEWGRWPFSFKGRSGNDPRWKRNSGCRNIEGF